MLFGSIEGNDAYKCYMNLPFLQEETRKDTDVIDLTVSLGQLSSTENTPTKPEQGKDLSHKAKCSKALFGDKLR